MSEVQSSEAAVEERLRTFMQALTDSEAYREFVDASEALEEDSGASALLREFQQKQRQMQMGGFDQEIMSELQELQSEMKENDTLERHREAQEALIELLQETNNVISEQIGREFAQSTGGGCC